MTKVEEIRQQILTLSAAELGELRDWLEQLDTDNWDRQLEADIEAGKLSSLAERALRAHAAGQTTEL